MDLDEVRRRVAEAVTGAGVICTAYPADAPVPPAAWVDQVSLDYQTVSSFCLPNQINFSVITCEQRNDRAEGIKNLESFVTKIVEAVEGLGAVRTIAVESGTTNVGSADVPAVAYQFQAVVSS